MILFNYSNGRALLQSGSNSVIFLILVMLILLIRNSNNIVKYHESNIKYFLFILMFINNITV